MLRLLEHERTALFIDGPNAFAATKALGFDIDYSRLLSLLRQRSEFYRGFYYTAVLNNDDRSDLQPLIDWLDYNGYRVITKAAREVIDQSTGQRRVKNNMTVELAVDALLNAEHYDHLLLFSGHGDFRRMVEAVQDKGKLVSVISTNQPGSNMIADELRRQADYFVDLNSIRPNVERRVS